MTTDLERRLTDDLHELADHEPVMPDLAAIERRGRALRRRGLAARGTAGVAIVAGATVLATAVNTGQAPTELPSAHTIAVRMVAAVKQATSNSTYITTINNGKQISTMYTDLAGRALEVVSTTESGTLLYQIGMRWHGNDWDTRTVDYRTRTWGQATRPASKDATVGPGDVWAVASASGPVDTAQQFAEAVNVGQLASTGQTQHRTPDVTYTYTVTGTETVDGQLCYRVATTSRHHLLNTLWINKATALPVRTIGHPGGDTVVLTYQWRVPRDQTPASLWPAPPAGFTRHETK